MLTIILYDALGRLLSDLVTEHEMADSYEKNDEQLREFGAGFWYLAQDASAPAQRTAARRLLRGELDGR